VVIAIGCDGVKLLSRHVKPCVAIANSRKAWCHSGSHCFQVALSATGCKRVGRLPLRNAVVRRGLDSSQRTNVPERTIGLLRPQDNGRYQRPQFARQGGAKLVRVLVVTFRRTQRCLPWSFPHVPDGKGRRRPQSTQRQGNAQVNSIAVWVDLMGVVLHEPES